MTRPIGTVGFTGKPTHTGNSVVPLGREQFSSLHTGRKRPAYSQASRWDEAANYSFFSNSCNNHNFAVRQSRLTMSVETPIAEAVSATVRPPKNRNSTTRLFR